MANYQVNGAATTASSTRNNRGVAIQVGNSTAMTNVNLGVAAATQNGATVVEGSNGVSKILSAGRFAKTTPREYVIPQVTTTLAGVANTSLLSGASDFGDRHPIHKRLHFRVEKRATAIRAGYWNIYSGVWTTPPATADDVATIGVDNAANPTRLVPGELVYLDGSPSPILDDYQPNTGS